MVDTRKFNCPCCSFPTLSERSAYDICTICWWEDDGQDEVSKDEVWGGPNGKYSLSNARLNFEDHGHMYDSLKGIEVVEKPSAARRQLLNYVDRVSRKEIILEPEKLNCLVENQRSANA